MGAGINGAYSKGSASPLTDKGDLYGRNASADARIGVGTDDQVLTADSTAAEGVAWRDPSGGASAALAVFYTNQNPPAFSGSQFASKGSTFTCIKNVNINHVTAFFGTNTSATYKLVLAEVSGGSDTIDAIIATSQITATNTSTRDTMHTFVFSAPVTLVSGKNYAFIFVRTDGNATAINPIAFPSGTLNSSSELLYLSSSRYASTDPQVSDVIRFDTATGIQCEIYFETGASTTEVASAIDISGFISGLIDDAEIALVHQVSRGFTLKAGLTGSTAYAQTTATANATIDIQKNGSSIGSIDFALGTNVATFTFTSDTSFVVGDRLLFVGQGTSDVTLQDVSFTLTGDLT